MDANKRDLTAMDASLSPETKDMSLCLVLSVMVFPYEELPMSMLVVAKSSWSGSLSLVWRGLDTDSPNYRKAARGEYSTSW